MRVKICSWKPKYLTPYYLDDLEECIELGSERRDRELDLDLRSVSLSLASDSMSFKSMLRSFKSTLTPFTKQLEVCGSSLG